MTSCETRAREAGPPEIQEEAVGPANPLATLDADYRLAVLHIAWDRAAGIRTLLFAFVELIPAEVPPPLDDYEPKHLRSSVRLGSHSQHYVYVRHAVVTARAGIDWYLACRAGTACLRDVPLATLARLLGGAAD